MWLLRISSYNFKNMNFNSSKQFVRKLIFHHFIRTCHEGQPKAENIVKKRKGTRTTHSKRINDFFSKDEDLKKIKEYIPPKYLQLIRRGKPESLYLICSKIAKIITSHVIPMLNLNSKQIICETNAGLGLIATELLENGVPLVRLYEACPDFRLELKDFGVVYPGRVELFTKDIFHLDRYAYMDKQDRANRVELLLKHVPKRSWLDDPVMTIVGTMTKISFIRYLIQSLVLQKDIVYYGRIQLFAIMKPRDYAVLSGGPKDNLFAYQNWTVLFNLLFDYELLEKFPRDVFLPWESPISESLRHYYPANLEPDKMYFVKINFKKDMPVPTQNLLPLFHFVRQVYGKGNNKVIPTVEKWVPECGVNIILPKLKHDEYFEDINIFTKFRELTPWQILSVFNEMVNHPAYTSSPFTAMIESELLKHETIETNLSEATQLEKNIVADIEEKLDMK